jgi:acyl-CoA dehydrogenase
MIDFTLSDEQKALRELAHDFAAKEIRPVAGEYVKEGTWPQEIIDKAHELGLMNVHVPEEYGGPGLCYLDGCLIEEELSWGCSGITTSLGNLFVDHSQIVQLECPRRGIWGTKSLWGRVVTYPSGG